MFERLTNRVSSIIAPGPFTTIFDQLVPPQKPKRKPRSSGEAPSFVTDRTIQPQQQYQQPASAQAQPQHYYFTPMNVNEPDQFTSQWNQTVPATQGEQQAYHGKKRGRPSKAEYEIKAREAAERGEPWPPPKKIKNARPSVEGGALLSDTAESTPRAIGIGGVGKGPPSKKKVARKSKPVPVASVGIPPRTSSAASHRNFALGVPASAADQLQIEVFGNQMRSTIPETQASEFAASESLMTGLQEQVAQSEARSSEPPVLESTQERQETRQDTVQSSETLQEL